LMRSVSLWHSVGMGSHWWLQTWFKAVSSNSYHLSTLVLTKNPFCRSNYPLHVLPRCLMCLGRTRAAASTLHVNSRSHSLPVTLALKPGSWTSSALLMASVDKPIDCYANFLTLPHISRVLVSKIWESASMHSLDPMLMPVLCDIWVYSIGCKP
jgi:hypothetical protein